MASTATNYLTILGSGGESEPSCCVTTRSERLLFNCPEGTQRAMTEHKLKLSNKMRNVFFTRADWNLVTGITDVILKACEEGQETLRLAGPDMREYIMSTSYFLGQRPQMKLELYSLPRSGIVPAPMRRIQLEDGTAIDLVLVNDDDDDDAASAPQDAAGCDHAAASPPATERKNPRTEDDGSPQSKRMRTNDGSSCAPSTAEQVGPSGHAGGEAESVQRDSANMAVLPRSVELLGGAAESSGISELVLCYSPYHRRKLSHRAQELRARPSAQGSVCYVVTFPPLPGKFDAKAADALGVKGKLRRTLIQGQSVTLADGTTVEPHQCVGAGQPGGAAVVVDCRSVAQARALLRGQGPMAPLYSERAGGAGVGPVCVVHMGPEQVVCSSEYRAWMAKLPVGPAHSHIVINHNLAPQRPLLAASERYLKLLNAIDADTFPLSHAPYHQLLQHGDATAAEHPAQPHPSLPSAVVGWPLLRYTFPPHKQPGLACAVPDTAMLHYYCLQGCICPPAGGLAVLDRPSLDAEGACGAAPQHGAAVDKVVFLGTGASAPFKYRTVSSILLFLVDGSTLILDAGDGTYGALVRKYGTAGASVVLRRLRMVWVSHKHADHISGVAGLLLRRQQALAAAEPTTQSHHGASTAGRKGAGVVCGVCGVVCAFESSWEMHHRACHPRHKMSKQACKEPEQVGTDGLVVVGPMWLDAWLRTLGRLEELNYEFIECEELTGSAASYCRQRISDLVGGSVRSVLVQHSFPSYGMVLETGGFKLVYSGDTRPCDALAEAGLDADLLVHEATFDDEMEEKAVGDRHSTVREALVVSCAQSLIDTDAHGVAAKMRAKSTILTHFSSRFEKLLPDLQLYGSLGEKVACAVDGMEVSTQRLSELPAISLKMAEKLVEQYAEL